MPWSNRARAVPVSKRARAYRAALSVPVPRRLMSKPCMLGALGRFVRKRSTECPASPCKMIGRVTHDLSLSRRYSWASIALKIAHGGRAAWRAWQGSTLSISPYAVAVSKCQIKFKACALRFSLQRQYYSTKNSLPQHVLLLPPLRCGNFGLTWRGSGRENPTTPLQS